MSLEGFIKTIHFKGIIKGESGSSQDAILEIKYSTIDPSILNVTGYLLADLSGGVIGILTGSSESVVKGHTEFGRAVELINPWAISESGNKVEIGCSGFKYYDEPPCKKGKCEIHVQIPYTELARQTLVSIFESSKSDVLKSKIPIIESPITWKSEFDKFSLLKAPDTFYDRTTELRTTKVEALLFAETKLENSVQLSEVADSVENELLDSIYLLSFFSRKFLYPYDFLFLCSEGSHSWNFTKHYYRSKGSESNNSPLVQHHELGTRMDELLRTLKRSPMKDELIRSMIYYVSSFYQVSIESEIGAVFMSLESLVNGFAKIKGNENVLPPDVKEQLKAEMEKVITRVCDFSSVEPSLRDSLIGRLDSFDQKSLKHRLLYFIDVAQVPIDDLWKEGVDFRKKLQQIIDRRNSLVHRAKLQEKLSVHSNDVERLRLIIARGIIRLLEWHPNLYLIEGLRAEFWLRFED